MTSLRSLALLGLALCACSSGYLVLDVTGVPEDEAIDRFVVRATVGVREAALTTLGGAPGPSVRLGLETPLDLAGPLVVSVEAWNGRGCRVARGRGEAPALGRSVSIPVPLQAFAGEGCPDGGWLWEQPLPFGYNFRAVLDLGAGPVWAAGQPGVVLRSDGGRWRRLPLLDAAGAPLPPLQIEALGGTDADHVLAGGDEGLVLECDAAACRQIRRGGPFVTGVAASMEGVWAVNVAGDVLFGARKDGGYEWREIHPQNPVSLRVLTVSQGVAYAGGDRYMVLRCRPDGCTQSGLPILIEPMAFRGGEVNGLAVANGRVWVSSKLTHAFGCYGVISSAPEGLMTGWQFAQSAAGCELGPLAVLGEELFVLYDNDAVLRLPMDSPGGAGQRVEADGYLIGLSVAAGPGGPRLWVAGHEGVLRRFEGPGLTPAAALPEMTLEEGVDVQDLFGVSFHEIYALATRRVGGPPIIYRFQGASWIKEDLPAESQPRRLHGAGDRVWAVGDGCTVLLREGGAWRRVEHGALAAACGDASDLRAVWAGPGDPWVVGTGLGVYRVGPETARRVSAPMRMKALNAVWGRGGEVFAVSEDGTILRCVEEGCEVDRAADGKALQDVWARPAGEVFAVGGEGPVLVRGPGGTWGKMSGEPPDLRGLTRMRVRGSDSGEVWIAGGDEATDFASAALHLRGDVWDWEPATSQGYPLYGLWLDPAGQPWIAGWGGAVLRRLR